MEADISCLYDTQPSTVTGIQNEFISSPRIDNLMTCFASIEGICEAVEAEAASGTSKEENIRCVILFDNEEVGSVSNHGAESNLLPSFVEMVSGLTKRGYYQILANSFLISADMGHAIHPNYENKYETNNAPRMNQGVVIKTNGGSCIVLADPQRTSAIPATRRRPSFSAVSLSVPTSPYKNLRFATTL